MNVAGPQTNARIQDRALVLRKVEYGDTSLILSLFTREHGIVHVLAKGAHRAKNPLWGSLDLPAYLEIEYPFRSQREVQVLTYGKLIDAFFSLREDLERFYLALYVVELLEEAGQPAGSSELFDLSLGFFRALSERPIEPTTLLLGFELHFLSLLGLQPAFLQCARCQKGLTGKPALRFFPAAGGTLCASCVQTSDRENAIPTASLQIAGKLSQSEWIQVLRTRLAPKTRSEIRRALDSFLRYHWERLPKTHRQMNALYSIYGTQKV